jgi:hypothetical protein
MAGSATAAAATHGEVAVEAAPPGNRAMASQDSKASMRGMCANAQRGHELRLRTATT